MCWLWFDKQIMRLAYHLRYILNIEVLNFLGILESPGSFDTSKLGPKFQNVNSFLFIFFKETFLKKTSLPFMTTLYNIEIYALRCRFSV